MSPENAVCLQEIVTSCFIFITSPEIYSWKNGVAQSLCMWEASGAFDPLWHDRKEARQKELLPTTASSVM